MNFGQYKLREEVLSDPANDRDLEELGKAIPRPLPLEYVELLKESDGFEGFVGDEGKFIHFYSLAEIGSRNSDYRVDKEEPELLLVGDDLAAMGFFVSKSPTSRFEWAVIPLMEVGLPERDQYRVVLTSFKHFAEYLSLPWGAEGQTPKIKA
jgi:hypothetical protein